MSGILGAQSEVQHGAPLLDTLTIEELQAIVDRIDESYQVQIFVSSLFLSRI